MKGPRYLIRLPSRRDKLPRYFWQPSTKLRAMGFAGQRVPSNWAEYTDGDALLAAAVARAEELNAELDRAIPEIKLSQAVTPVPAATRKSMNALRAHDAAMHQPDSGRFLYVMGALDGLQKIGISRTPELRRLALERSSGRPIQIWFLVGGRHISAARLEKAVHARLKVQRTLGEWFSVAPLDAIAAVVIEMALLYGLQEQMGADGV